MTKSQKNLLNELKSGRTIVEDSHGKKLSYFTAEVDSHSHSYGYPQYCNKKTVWVLLSLGLIEEIMLWPDHSNPKKAYMLSNTRQQCLDVVG